MTHEEFCTMLAERGLELDEGCLIGGPFIPDGVWRVYDTESHNVLATGRDLESVMEDFS